MTTSGPTATDETSLTRDVLYAGRYYLGGRRGLLLLAAAAAIGGLTLNWSWLVAAGIAPLLIGLLPCAAMCALGLCAHRMAGRSRSTDAPTLSEDHPAVNEAPLTLTSAVPSARSCCADSDSESNAVGPTMVDRPPHPIDERRTTDA